MGARAEAGRDAARRGAASRKALSRLPGLDTIRRDLLRAAQELGVGTVRALSGLAAREGLSLLHAGWTYLRRLTQDQSLGRDDDNALGH
ncbi:MAG TPA: hypothetical protein VHR45_16760 [Thermoanaerobaculia bacterium]|nr:hypothetical protein [Thermoanaerobaculia bacterium]